MTSKLLPTAIVPPSPARALFVLVLDAGPLERSRRRGERRRSLLARSGRRRPEGHVPGPPGDLAELAAAA